MNKTAKYAEYAKELRNGKMKPYRVDYWDSFDRSWSGVGDEFDDLNEAIARCNQMQAELPQGNKDCGEHYGVIDLRLGREVYCPAKR